MRSKNILFTSLVCFLLLCPAILFGLQRVADINLPSSVTAEDAAYLTGGISKVSIRDQASIAGFASGDLQGALEDAVGNYIPFKAEVLLANAALQRSAIACSNELFRWDCYPTYFGSTKLYDASCDALFEMPLLDESRVVERSNLLHDLTNFGLGLTKVAEQFPDKNFYVIVADRSATSESNPAYRLVTNKVSTAECAQVLSDVVSATNVTIEACGYQAKDEYLKAFYRTDHHWNGFGAIDAFNTVADHAGYRVYEPEGVIEFGGLVFNGTLSRRGLMCLNTSISEPLFDTKNLDVGEGSKKYFEYLLESDGNRRIAEQGLRAEYDFYSAWYGGDRACVIDNQDSGEGAALLISDSYGDAFRWVLAENYAVVSGNMDLKKPQYSSEDLASVVRQSNCRDIYIVGWAGGFSMLG